MTNMKYKYSIVVGDWSCDGHEKSDKFIFDCTHSKADIIKSYKQAVNKSGVALHSDKDKIEILGEYEDNIINNEAIGFLEGIGCKFEWRDNEFEVNGEERELYCGPDDVFHLFLEMVSTQLEGFKYKRIDEEIESINGFWDKKFNESIGYGVYT